MTDSPEFRTLAAGATLRPARPEDVAGILVLIQELADYEREPDAVKNTPELLHDTLFGDAPTVFAHVIELDGEVVGTAIWFINYSTWTGRSGIYLEDFYVRATHRGRGYGKALLRELAGICVARGYTRLNWAVLNWNQPSIDLYDAIGGHGQTDWTTYVLDGAPLAAMAGGDADATRR